MQRLTPFLMALCLLFAIDTAFAQTLDDSCIVSILNRTVQVAPDGSWSMPNVPSNMGRVRARATCIKNGQTTSGQSDYFPVANNGITEISPIRFDAVEPIPTALTIDNGNVRLTQVGQTLALKVTATYSDGSTQDVTDLNTGTNYSTSNPGIALIQPDGLLAAVGSGSALIVARKDGATGFARVTVIIGGDTDNDGLPDDYERTHGLNPQDPIDAREDPDRDGLSTLQEFNAGTDPKNPDTDGDTLLDGEEVQSGADGFITNPLAIDTDGDELTDNLEVLIGSNPTDPASANYGAALASLQVTPSDFTLIMNTLIGEASRQLKVTGVLIDGRSIDLTAKRRGTSYASSNIATVSFGAIDGQLFAGQDGTATVTVRNGTLSANAQVTIESFSPKALSFIAIPGYANSVDVAGDHAYVAAGSTGLQVVNVNDRNNPRIDAALDTPGNANDIRVSGNIAYIADGVAGLQIIDIGSPTQPRLVGTYNTPDVAWDVAVVGNIAYIADGASGLHILNIANPQAPVLLGSIDTPGTAKGVDISGNLAIVADGPGVRIIDIANPATPVLIGGVPTTDARDLVVDGSIAYIADYTGSLRIVDFSTPSAPKLVASTTQALGGILMNVARSRQFVFGADIFFVNGVPITDIGNPSSPVVRARLDFPARDDNGIGIAVDNQYVYLTADRGAQENGTSGDTRLYIGQYLRAEDTAGIAPTVTLIKPLAGQSFYQGAKLPIQASASDDVLVAYVEFLIDGVVVSKDSASPYELSYSIPANATQLSVSAAAVDMGGNRGVAEAVEVEVVPDPGTTVVGRVIGADGAPVAGATVTAGTLSGTTIVDGTFSIPAVPAGLGEIIVDVTALISGRRYDGKSVAMTLVAGGVTEVGDIALRPRGIVVESFSRARSLVYNARNASFVGGEIFADARTALLSTANFGPNGIVPRLVVLGLGIETITADALNGVDIFVLNPLSATAELTAAEAGVLEQFVQRGGALVEFRNLPASRPPLFGTTAGPGIGDTNAVITAAGTVNPIVSGPFGQVNSPIHTGYNFAFAGVGLATDVARNGAGPNILFLEPASGIGRGHAVLMGDEEVFASGFNGGGSNHFSQYNNRVLFLNTFAFAAEASVIVPLVNSTVSISRDFESGTLAGFTASGVLGGVAMVSREGTSFSGGSNTTTIAMSGAYAVNVRSSGPAPTDSVGVLTSDPFVAGDRLLFLERSESRNVHIEVRLLNASDNSVLMAQPIQPTLGWFKTHAIDTTAFKNRQIKFEIRQNTMQAGLGWYTLIDDIQVQSRQ